MNVKEIKAQLQPQIKRAQNNLRMKIAQAARYNHDAPNTPYSVQWDSQYFYSDDTRDLVDQVVAWLKRSKNDRAEDIKERREWI